MFNSLSILGHYLTLMQPESFLRRKQSSQKCLEFELMTNRPKPWVPLMLDGFGLRMARNNNAIALAPTELGILAVQQPAEVNGRCLIGQ